ncbi:MAG: M3 family oligoendopeptidase [Bacilli bacterium]|nr:M3 family oligoendopeptidase [Bacilli bacterium]
MKKDLKFEEYPLRVPNQKKIVSKITLLIEELKKANDAKTAASIVRRYNKYMEKLSTDTSVIYVLYSLNTDNMKYVKAQNTVDEVMPNISNYINQFQGLLLKAPYRSELEKIFGSYLFQKYEIDAKCFDQKIIPDLIEENKLVSQYDGILGSAQIEFRGNIYNLSQLGKFTQDLDRQTRKEATQAIDAWVGEHEKEIGDIYDKLVHVRDSMAKKLGYPNYIPLGYYRLGRTDYDAEMVKGYRDQIARDVVPVCNKLYKNQMKGLGIKNPQCYDYNLSFKSGNPVPAGGTQYLIEQAHVMYSGLGQESKEFFEFMMNHNLLDLEARKGKTTGGYCTYFPLYKAPFIFSNFNGTSGDVNVLTHEGGHALQAYLSSGIKVPEYQNPTLESCEIHSMSMEFFAWPYLEGFFGKDADKYRYHHLADAIEFLPYGATIDEFQHWVYENPNATHEERCAFFSSLEKKYTPHKKYDDTPISAKGTRWLRQSHVFTTAFYYIDYTLAQVVAFQFKVEMDKNHEKAYKKYIKLCKMGGKYPFVSLLAHNHLRNPFEDGNIKKVIKPLEKVLKGFDLSKFN